MSERKPDSENASRRKFLRTAAASVAGLAVGKAAADTATTKGNAAALKASPPPLTPEEHAKDKKRVQAESLLRELGGNVEIRWVKGKLPAQRRIIQMEG